MVVLKPEIAEKSGINRDMEHFANLLEVGHRARHPTFGMHNVLQFLFELRETN